MSSTECKHKWEPLYEDHILLGCLYYGRKCKKCYKMEYPEPGPLELGVYK